MSLKRYLFFIGCIGVGLLRSPAQNTAETNFAFKSDWEQEFLQGQVASYVERSYELFGDTEYELNWDNLSPEMVEENFYDEAGNKKKSLLEINGRIKNHSLYFYDEQGVKTATLTNGNLSEFIFDRELRVLTEYYTNEYKEQIVSAISHYDSLGNIQKIQRFHSNGELDSELIYSYNANNLLTKESVYFNHENQHMDLVITSYFDSEGRTMIKTYADGEPVYTEYLNKEYDEAGNWIRRVEYRKEQPIKLMEREYTYY